MRKVRKLLKSLSGELLFLWGTTYILTQTTTYAFNKVKLLVHGQNLDSMFCQTQNNVDVFKNNLDTYINIVDDSIKNLDNSKYNLDDFKNLD